MRSFGKRTIGCLTGLQIALLGICQTQDSTPVFKNEKQFEIGIDYTLPYNYYRQIQSVSLNLFFWKPYSKKVAVYLHPGLIATFSRGNIIREAYVDSLLTEIKTNTSAFGIGPALQVVYPILVFKKISLEANVSAAFLLYTSKFPPGGDFYNFLGRPGASVSLRLDKKSSLRLNCQWLHLSNGKGLGPDNPVYEGIIIGICGVRYF
jgi:hypothetical protein